LETIHRYEGGYNSIQLGMRVYVLVGFVEQVVECRRILDGRGTRKGWKC
jgi:hypothetical protein